MRPDARRPDEKDAEHSGADAAGPRGERERLSRRKYVSYIAVAVFVRAADASLAADRSIVTEV